MKYSRIIFALIALLNVSFISPCDDGDFVEIDESPAGGAGSTPVFISYSPVFQGNLFAAVAAFGGTISEYTVNQTTGAFALAAGFPLSVPYTPSEVVYSPVYNNTLYLAVSDASSGNIYVYTVNATNGALTPVPDSPFLTPYGGGANAIAFSPVIDNNLYFAAVGEGATGANNGPLSMYQVDPFTNNLTFLATYPAPSSPHVTDTFIDVTFSPVFQGTLALFAFDATAATINSYSVNSSTGALTLLTELFDLDVSSIACSPLINSNTFPILAAARLGDDNISSYIVNMDSASPDFGFLTLNNTLSTGFEPEQVSFSPIAGGLLFVATPNAASDSISVFQINTNTSSPEFGFLEFIQTLGTLSVPVSLAFSPFVQNYLFAADVGVEQTYVDIYQVTLLVPIITTVSTTVRCGCQISIQATIIGGTPPYTVVWSDGLTQIVSGNTFTRTVTANTTTTYTIVQVTDANGCVAGPSNSVTIGVFCPCSCG